MLGAFVAFPAFLLLALASGLAAAAASSAELRISPRPALLSRGAMAYAWYAWLVLVPAALFLYLFHGDWFLLYLLDVSRIPSALSLFGFLGLAGLGALGFQLGASLVRAQREGVVWALAAGLLVLAATVPIWAGGRLSVVGTFDQFHGGYGLRPLEEGPLMPETYLFAAAQLLGLGALLVRLRLGGRRWIR